MIIFILTSIKCHTCKATLFYKTRNLVVHGEIFFIVSNFLIGQSSIHYSFIWSDKFKNSIKLEKIFTTIFKINFGVVCNKDRSSREHFLNMTKSRQHTWQRMVHNQAAIGPTPFATQIAKPFEATSIRHRFDAKVSDRCLMNFDSMVFVIWKKSTYIISCVSSNDLRSNVLLKEP